MQSQCPKCNGTGWVVVERGGLSGAEPCECLANRRTMALEEAAGIPPLYRDASLDNFLLPEGDAHLRRELANVLLMIRAYARDFPYTDKPGLLFVGDPGTGKTHLAVATLRMLIRRGFQGVFFDYQNLLDQIRASYDPASGATDREAYRAALEAEVLLLDDLGAHRISDWVEDIVTAIITYRCNHKKPLIATTNLPDPDITGPTVERVAGVPGQYEYRITLEDRIGSRARSRLFEMCKIIRMPAVGDFRLRMSQLRRR